MKTDKRKIEITLETAKEWYKQWGNLREIALQAFTKNELAKETGVFCVVASGNNKGYVLIHPNNYTSNMTPLGVAIIEKEHQILLPKTDPIVAYWGVPKVKLPDIPENTVDGRIPTLQIIAAMKGKLYKKNDFYQFKGAPAAEYCHELSYGPFKQGFFHLPSKVELDIWSKHCGEVNKARMVMGLRPIPYGYYWSCILYSSQGAWYLGQGTSGSASWNSNWKSRQDAVLACASAF